MRKVLITSNSASMINLFNQLNINILQSMGYEIHVACNFYASNTISMEAVALVMDEWKAQGIVVHQVDYLRSPFTWKSFHIYRQIKTLIQTENFDLIHCHTPIVAVFARLAAAKARRQGKTKLIYTAHGFHFYKGCPFENWLIYYPIEKLLARCTDVLITINTEDFQRATAHIPCTHIEHVHGIGVDTQHIRSAPFDRSMLCKSLNISGKSRIILSAGELNANKNHSIVIKALGKIKSQDLHYLIAGIGADKEKLVQMADSCGCGDNVHFLGYRKDIISLLKCSDIFVFPSFREGLSVILMEAMAAGVPIVASRIRGNVDLIEDGVNGFLCDPEDAEGLADKIQTLLEEPDLAQKFRTHSLEKIKEYDKSIVEEQLRKIYCEMDACVNVATEKV